MGCSSEPCLARDVGAENQMSGSGLCEAVGGTFWTEEMAGPQALLQLTQQASGGIVCTPRGELVRISPPVPEVLSSHTLSSAFSAVSVPLSVNPRVSVQGYLCGTE